MGINKGDIFYAELENGIGSEQTGLRPVVILQNDIGNKFSPTVIIAPLTTKINSKAKLPTHVFIKSIKKRLLKDSLIMTEQIRVLDKSRLKYYVGALEHSEKNDVDKALIIALGIDVNTIRRKDYLDILERDDKLIIASKNQIASYGVVAREYLKNSGNMDISNKLFKDYITTLIDLFGTNEIEKQADKIIKE